MNSSKSPKADSSRDAIHSDDSARSSLSSGGPSSPTASPSPSSSLSSIITNDRLSQRMFDIGSLERNIRRLDKDLLLSTQLLTSDFCVRHILSLDADSIEEGKAAAIFDKKYILSKQKHISDAEFEVALQLFLHSKNRSRNNSNNSNNSISSNNSSNNNRSSSNNSNTSSIYRTGSDIVVEPFEDRSSVGAYSSTPESPDRGLSSDALGLKRDGGGSGGGVYHSVFGDFDSPVSTTSQKHQSSTYSTKFKYPENLSLKLSDELDNKYNGNYNDRLLSSSTSGNEDSEDLAICEDDLIVNSFSSSIDSHSITGLNSSLGLYLQGGQSSSSTASLSSTSRSNVAASSAKVPTPNNVGVGTGREDAEEDYLYYVRDLDSGEVFHIENLHEKQDNSSDVIITPDMLFGSKK